jgi:elongation factor P
MAEYIKATKLRVGNLVLFEGELYRIHSMDHRTPGNYQAVCKIRMRNLTKGAMIDRRLNSDDLMERAILDTAEMEYLYAEGNGYVFMNTDNYEQITLDKEVVGEASGFILSNTKVKVDFYNEQPVGIELPKVVVLKVTEAEPNMKRSTATAQLKYATLETGIKVQVPGFVEVGDLVKVDTETGDYISRANNYDEKN